MCRAHGSTFDYRGCALSQCSDDYMPVLIVKLHKPRHCWWSCHVRTRRRPRRPFLKRMRAWRLSLAVATFAKVRTILPAPAAPLLLCGICIILKQCVLRYLVKHKRANPLLQFRLQSLLLLCLPWEFVAYVQRTLSTQFQVRMIYQHRGWLSN